MSRWGVGTGKTRVIASRITHLIKEIGYEPDQIVSVTFTNKAAREMKDRLDLFLGVDKTDEIVMGESFLFTYDIYSHVQGK